MPYSSHLKLFLVIISLLIFPNLVLAQGDCGAPELSLEQIHEIIKKERLKRSDLPQAFPKYEYSLKKQGCYYIYFEKKQPYEIHYSRSFTLNRFGAIVEVRRGHGLEVELKCPEKVYSESEVEKIIKKERELHRDIPPPFSNFKVQFKRIGCSYWYVEVELPEESKNYIAFKIDAFGGLMKFSRDKRKSQSKRE